MNEALLELKKYEILCAEGELELDMFYLKEGELLVFIISDKGDVTPLSHIPAGNFIGEQAFFDRLPRSANVITTTDCKLIKIPEIDIEKNLPKWFLKFCAQLSEQIRTFDAVIRQKGIKKTKAATEAALKQDEQARILSALKSYKENN